MIFSNPDYITAWLHHCLLPHSLLSAYTAVWSLTPMSISTT